MRVRGEKAKWLCLTAMMNQNKSVRYFSLYTYNVSTALNRHKKGYACPMYVKYKSQLRIQKVLP